MAQVKQKSKKEINIILQNAGQALINLEIEKSLQLSKNALQYSNAIKDDELIAKSYNIIGLNFEEFNNANKGLEYYNKALKYANLTKNDSIKCWINNNLGNVYSYRNIDKIKGIKYYLKGLQFAKKIKDSVEIMYTNLSLTGAYFAVDDYKNGLKYLETAKKYVDRSDDIEAKISLHTLYGSYYSFKNFKNLAEYHFITAINYGNKIKDKLTAVYLIDVYKDFSDYYKKNKNFEKAFYYLNLYDQSNKEIYNTDRLKNAKLYGNQIELYEYKARISKIEGEYTTQFKDLKKSKIILLLSLFICAILSLLTYVFYRNNRIREKLNTQLVKTNQELSIAKEKAEESTKLKTQFVSTITHELRTPLYGVVGITNIIMDEHKELENSPHLKSLKFSARYLLSLVNDLLQINKIEEKRIILENMVFNLADELKIISESLGFIALKNNNKLFLDIDATIPEFIIGDKLRLSQIFINLLSNALKFTANGEVYVMAKLQKVSGSINTIYFEVKDSGVGIAKDDMENIFEKFVQLERKESDYQGTGLGLAIVKKLLEVFNSKINLESELGKGTKFYFTIDFDADIIKRNTIINNINVNLSYNKVLKILIVEDNKINQIVTKKIIESSNYKCFVVDDGYAAINLLETETFDMILMDINMPIINGFETSKLIRKKGITTPIIALTAFDKQEVIEQSLASGMNDILVKPFESVKLFEIIKNLTE